MPRSGPATRVRPVRTRPELRIARRLLREYERSIGVDLCFQDFAGELRGLPGEYRPPGGELWLARVGTRVVGVVALRRLKPKVGEMKRLYVRPSARGRGLGRRLVEIVLRAARRRGYRWIQLDTLPTMTVARALYRELGFVPVPPYRPNPIAGSEFLRLRL